MKNSIYISIICIFLSSFAYAQHNKMVVSLQGGKKNVITWGKLGYSYYHFYSSNAGCDTLICKGSGFEKGRIDHNILEVNKDKRTEYHLYNATIRKTVRRVRKTNSNAGTFQFHANGRSIHVNYSNADGKGNVDLEIELR